MGRYKSYLAENLSFR